MSIHLRIPGINGESSDTNHAGFMDVESVRFGIGRRITSETSTRNDHESANAETSDLFLTRWMDNATPALFIEACCGRGKTVTLRHTKTGTGSGADVYLEYTLHNAIVSKYTVRARSQTSNRPLEVVRISFTGLEARYVPYDEDGIAMAPLTQGFDTSTNERI